MAVTAIEARTIQFDRAPIGTRGYYEPQVDAFLERVAATLDGEDDLTAADVHDVAFSRAPLSKRGYDHAAVDAFLRLCETTLADTGGSGTCHLAPPLEHTHNRRGFWRR
ncbi:DivIVA domain-containing protein [Amycolatopsis samaneae]|uniref:DivIVA domain-containing protein n=1 Tax=Amycolatopsis samaneae TaxID=664691 RepID=A0ABW5GHZ6_9PSEU